MTHWSSPPAFQLEASPVRPGGGRLAGHVAPTPPVSGVKHGLELLEPPLSKLPKTSALETEAGRVPLQLSPDDSKALDFVARKVKSILGKRRSPSGTMEYLIHFEMSNDGGGCSWSYTWTPAQSLAGCIELLIRFEERQVTAAKKDPVMEATMMAAEATEVAVDAARMALRCAEAKKQAASATGKAGALEAELARGFAAMAAAEQRWKAEAEARFAFPNEAARSAMAQRCCVAEEQASSAMAKVRALEAELLRAAAVVRAMTATEQRWKAAVASLTLVRCTDARSAEDARADAKAARADATDARALVAKEVPAAEAREVAASVKAAEQCAEKRWWRERALAFEEVLQGWRDAAMLEQWPAVAAGTAAFVEAAEEDMLYCPEFRVVADIIVEDLD